MATLPASRVVNVTLSRNDRFASRQGFGTILVLTPTAQAGEVDATIRTKAYGNMDEVAADWDAADDFYKQALAAFGRRPQPVQIKAGYYDNTTIDAEKMADQMDLIKTYDNGWYFVVIDAALRDDAAVQGLIEWTEANNKLAIIDSNDADMTDPGDTANIAASNKGEVERSAVFYHPFAAEYPAVSLAAYMATRDFDQADSAYTTKFKALPGISPSNLASADVNAVTGFTPGLGQAISTGHLANVYVNVGGQFMVAEGSVLRPNVFLDEIHASDWIIARTEEEILSILLNNARVPYTDEGMQQIASACRLVMQRAVIAGIVANDLDPLTGDYAPAYTITVPSVFDVPESQRKARIAPAIAVTFRYAGAVHFTSVNYQMTF